MDVTPDELAGIAGLFGGLRRSELAQACEEVAYKRSGSGVTETEVSTAIDTALDRHHLVRAGMRGETYLLPGPSAFPSVPAAAEDLPHIFDIEARDISRQEVADRIRSEAVAELQEQPSERRCEELLQLSYDLETWADIDASAIREAAEAIER